MKSDRVLIILSVLFLCLALTTAFDEVPVSQEVLVGTEAVFRCRHPTAFTIFWRVNNSPVGRNPPPDVTLGIITEDGNPVDTLTIVARIVYNGTTIECVAEFDNGTRLSSEPPAILLVQATTTTIPPTTTESVPLEGFTEDPSSLNVTAGKLVQFHCVHPTSIAVVWIINGTILTASNFPPGVSFSSTSIGSNGFRHTLTIDPTHQDDNTVLACALMTDDTVKSADALLRVQGSLDAPSHLSSSRDYATNTTTITWTPPPSIDLTNVEPDVVYCIEVENMTCGERGDVIVSECDITEPIYQSRDIPLNYIYNITVTPMSNVQGALNGTQAYLDEGFPILSEASSVFTSPDGTASAVVTMDITDHENKPFPSSYSISLTPVGTSDSTFKPTTAMIRSDSILLYISGLEEQMLLNLKVVAYTCDHNPLTNGFVLSTHYTQDISSSPAPGGIIVTGDFLNSSTTTGLLVIAYTSSSNVRYHLYSRTPNEQNFRTVINNLEAGDYHVSVFTVENGLPFREVATLPQRVRVTSTGVDTRIQAPIAYELQSTSTGVCITCTFLESSTVTDCVAVVHQRISQLNSSAGLMNIESSHKFTRFGDTASGCIEGVNLEDYQVGVVGGRQLDITSSSGVCDIECVSGSVSAGIITVVFAHVVIVIVYKCNGRKYRRKKSSHRIRVRLMNVESGLSTNHCDIVDHQDEKKQENTPLVRRVQTDGCCSGVEQLQPVSLTTQFEEASFTTSPVTPPRADDEVCLPGAVSEPAYADPALVKPSVSIPPVTEPSTYSNVEKFQNPQGLIYAMLEHVSQKQHNPQPDDCYTAKSEYSEVVIKKEECCKAKEGEDNRKKVAPQSVPPPTPCDTENLGKLLYSISYKWEKFALALSLDEDHIDDINTANETDEACLQDVVERYFDNGDFKHNWEEIVTTLRGVDEQLADKIRDLHVYPYKSSLSGQTQDMEDSNTTVNNQSDIENEGEKNEVVDSTQCEDGHCAALSSDDEGFDDTEKEEPPELEGDMMTPVQESGVSVNTEPDHQMSQDYGSLEVPTDINEALKLACVLNQTDSKRSDSKPKHFYSIRRQDSENSDSGLVSDNNPIISGPEKQSMYIYGDNVYLAGGGSIEFRESGYCTTACDMHSTDSFVDDITIPDVTPTTPTRSRRDHQHRYLINKKVDGAIPPCEHTQGATPLDHKPTDFVTVMPNLVWDGEKKEYMACGGVAIHSGSSSDMLATDCDSQKNLLVEVVSSPTLVTEQPKSSVQLQLVKETLKSSDNVDEVSQHSCTSGVGKKGGRSTQIPLDSAYVSERAEHRT